MVVCGLPHHSRGFEVPPIRRSVIHENRCRCERRQREAALFMGKRLMKHKEFGQCLKERLVI